MAWNKKKLENTDIYIYIYINIRLHIGPSSSRLSNAQAPVVPNVAHSCWNNNDNIRISDIIQIFK